RVPVRRGGGGVGAAGAVGVGGGGGDDLVRVAERDDDGAPVHEHVVHAGQGGLLTAVDLIGAGEPADDPVHEPALEPQPAGGVQELLELGGDIAVAGGRAEHVGVGPQQIVVPHLGDVLGGLLIGVPVGVVVDHPLRGELGRAEQPDLGAGLARTVVDLAGELGDVPGRAVVDDCDLG